MREKKDIRVFFALWPEAELRRQLAGLARQMPLERRARRVPDYNLHLTLHFIGNVLLDEFDCLRRRARKVTGRPFELFVDSHGSFRKSQVSWLGCSKLPAELIGLHRNLGEALRPCGFRPEARTFNPHVTVARKAGRRPEMPDFESLCWRVDNFALIESRATDTGVRYEVVETYPLT